MAWVVPSRGGEADAGGVAVEVARAERVGDGVLGLGGGAELGEHGGSPWASGRTGRGPRSSTLALILYRTARMLILSPAAAIAPPLVGAVSLHSLLLPSLSPPPLLLAAAAAVVGAMAVLCFLLVNSGAEEEVVVVRVG